MKNILVYLSAFFIVACSNIGAMKVNTEKVPKEEVVLLGSPYQGGNMGTVSKPLIMFNKIDEVESQNGATCSVEMDAGIHDIIMQYDNMKFSVLTRFKFNAEKGRMYEVLIDESYIDNNAPMNTTNIWFVDKMTKEKIFRIPSWEKVAPRTKVKVPIIIQM